MPLTTMRSPITLFVVAMQPLVSAVRRHPLQSTPQMVYPPTLTQQLLQLMITRQANRLFIRLSPMILACLAEGGIHLALPS